MIERIKRKISDSLHKIGILLYTYTILLILLLFYPSAIGSKHPHNDATNMRYIPKRNRGITQLSISKLTKWTVEKMKKTMDKIESKTTCRRLAKRKKIARKFAVKNADGKINHLLKIIAYPVLAMLDNQRNEPTQTQQRRTTFDTNSESIGIDNRCSACISNKIEDFIGSVTESRRTIKGFGGSHIRNIMKGTIQWKWEDDTGKIHQFKIPNSYYVPTGGMRLLSPQHWAQAQIKQRKSRPNGIGCHTYHNKMVLYWNDNNDRSTVPISRENNVATFYTAPGFHKFRLFCDQAQIEYDQECKDPMICEPVDIDDEGMSVDKNEGIDWPKNKERPHEIDFDIDGKSEGAAQIKEVKDRDTERTQNTTAELLEMHQRYGHIGFGRLREMAKQGIISSRFATCPIPACSACMFAKAKRKRWRDRPRNSYEKIECTNPGECVSVDQMVSPTPGLVAQMTGNLTIKRYRYATVYVDQATRLGYVHLQKTADVEETLEGKRAFESYARQRGVNVKSYQADNGIFRANKWVRDCQMKGQRLTFTGVNAHHQNGMAERRIGILQELTRAMLIHSQHKWPKVITPNLWPYAMRMANDCLNETPNMQDDMKRTSEQIFSDTLVQPNLKHHKVFGCPVYVLDEALQQGTIFHKWKERSRVGVYLGKSPNHARNIALVMNLKNGLVSPQFHVQFDNNFDTVKDDRYESTWQIRAGFVDISTKRKRDEYEGKRMENEKGKKISTNQQMELYKLNLQREMDSQRINEQAVLRDERQRRREVSKQSLSASTSEGGETPTSEGEGMEGAGIPIAPIDMNKGKIEVKETLAESPKNSDINEIFCMEASLPTKCDEESEPLVAYKAVADPDVMYLHQAMKERDKNKFIEAMNKEVKDQTENGNFIIVRKDQVPKNKTILKSVWQMRRKRDIKSRAIKKYKARLNIDGSRMIKGVDYDETYAPVAKWSTIRLILSLAAVHNWHTRQLDYVLAFPQAPVERELYMEVPKGFVIEDGRSEDYLLKIKRNIYGQKQAGLVWNRYLVDKLTKELGFKQSMIDECLFYRGRVLYALYTDDSILAGPCEKEINTIINQIKKAGLNITEEGDIQDFLGINIVREKNGDVTLSQPHLINQILTDLKMDKDTLKVKDIPCKSSTILTRGDKDKNFDRSFHYRSIIGKLNYLEKGTRSDISYITHQCARFTEAPKERHANAIRWLARYLKGTKDKGFIMRPDTAKGLEVYVDADFSGNWYKEDSLDIDTARSHHGYIIKYLNCPIV